MKIVLLSLLVWTTYAHPAAAQTPHPHDTRETFSVRVEVKDTPQQQIVYGRTLAMLAYQARDPHERLNAAAQAAAAFEVVAKRWPDNRQAVIDAALASADLFLATSSPSDAEKVLLTVEPIMNGERREASVDLGLGLAEMRLHRVDDAEKRFLAAERVSKRDSPEADFGATRELAALYRQRGNVQAARKRYRALVHHPLTPPEISARFLVNSMEMGVFDGSLGEMKKDLADFDAVIATVPPGASHERLKSDADRLRKKYNIQ